MVTDLKNIMLGIIIGMVVSIATWLLKGKILSKMAKAGENLPA